jgi:hypothetical protein
MWRNYRNICSNIFVIYAVQKYISWKRKPTTKPMPKVVFVIFIVFAIKGLLQSVAFAIVFVCNAVSIIEKGRVTV